MQLEKAITFPWLELNFHSTSERVYVCAEVLESFSGEKETPACAAIPMCDLDGRLPIGSVDCSFILHPTPGVRA